MADKAKVTKAPETYVLTGSQTNALAKAIAGSQDSRAQVATFRGAIASIVTGALRGKSLPKPDAERVASAVESDLKSRGYPAATIKVKKSRAMLLATCAPILPQAYERCAALRESLADTLKFCAALKRNDFNVKDAIGDFTKPKKVNFAASAAMHVNSIIGMKSLKSLAFTSTKAKRELRDWAERYGVKLSTKSLKSIA